MQMKASHDQEPIRAWTDPRLDFENSSRLRKSYIVASLPRSGSQFLSAELWKTGVLGAPCEYLHPAYDMRPMLNRLKASSPADYIAKLVACRTSPNGVFGMNAHVNHFESFLNGYPGFLEALSPVTYIHVTRRNKVAQAVSMAKAYQQAAWTSRQRASTSAPQYNRDMIAKSLATIEEQEAGWLRWFEAHGVTPFSLVYEDVAADPAGTVQRIMQLLGVENDERHTIVLPAVEKQADRTNKEWIERFERERQAGEPAAGAAEGAQRKGSAFFDRYDRFIKNMPTGGSFSTEFVDEMRLRHRYEAIIGRNRDLFRNARVLDIMSSDGRWSLAALDAGAAHVVGVEAQPRRVATAQGIFAEYGVDPKSYQFVNSEIFSALESFDPGDFDVIMCTHLFELFDPRLFFRHLHYMQPKHVILETTIAPGRGPLVRFALRLPDVVAQSAPRRNAVMVSTPSEELITFMCEYFGFRCRQIDWLTMGIKDWTGVHDYEDDRRRTYVLDRIS